MVTAIAGVPPSAELRERLAGQRVLLAFSGGKDSIAAWLALEDCGAEVLPYNLYLVPGLSFVDESMDRFEDRFGTRIRRYPHPSLYRWLNALMFQPPERCAVIEAAALPVPTYAQMETLIRDDFGVGDAAWVCDGVRAADSIQRRLAVQKYGAMKPRNHKCSPVWDWLKAEVLGRIADAGIGLPPEYEWFKRSFDGVDARFLIPLREHRPADYARVLEWFPLAELELVRRGVV